MDQEIVEHEGDDAEEVADLQFAVHDNVLVVPKLLFGLKGLVGVFDIVEDACHDRATCEIE